MTSEQYSSLFTATQSAHALYQLLSDVLDLSKVEAGKLVIQFNQIDITNLIDLLEDVVHLYSNPALIKTLSLYLDYPIHLCFPSPKGGQQKKKTLEVLIANHDEGDEEEDEEEENTKLKGKERLSEAPSFSIKSNDGKIKPLQARSNLNIRRKSDETLKLQDDDRVEFFVSDILRIRQVVVNLVSNAIKYTNSGHVIVRLIVNKKKEYPIEIEVEDTGVGIEKDQMKKVFSRYNRVHEDSLDYQSQKADSTGIGLTIAKRITELLGGNLSISSIKGEGTKFTFSLPLDVKNNSTSLMNYKRRSSISTFTLYSSPSSPSFSSSYSDGDENDKEKNNNSQQVDQSGSGFSLLPQSKILALKKREQIDLYISSKTPENRKMKIPSFVRVRKSFSNLKIVFISPNSEILPDNFSSFLLQFDCSVFRFCDLNSFKEFLAFSTSPTGVPLSPKPPNSSNDINNNNHHNHHQNNDSNPRRNSPKITSRKSLLLSTILNHPERVCIFLNVTSLFTTQNWKKIAEKVIQPIRELHFDPTSSQSEDDQMFIDTIKDALDTLTSSISELPIGNLDPLNNNINNNNNNNNNNKDSNKDNKDKGEEQKSSPPVDVSISRLRLFLLTPQSTSPLLASLLPSYPLLSDWLSIPMLPSKFFYLICNASRTSSQSSSTPFSSMTKAHTAPALSSIIDSKKLQKSEEEIHILIAEDNDVNQLVAKKLISQILPNAKVEIAKNGLEAVDLFKSSLSVEKISKYNIILMDLQMPIMDGYTSAHELRKFERENKHSLSIPIIALTAEAMSGVKQNCLDSGMDDIINKPLLRNQLISVFNTYALKHRIV